MSSASRDRPAGAGIDADDVQLLFADLQTPLVAHSQTNPPEAIARAAAAMARVAEILKLPMLFSVVAAGGGSDGILPKLRSFTMPAITHPRVSISPLGDPAITQALEIAGRRTLFIAAYTAETALLQSVLDATAAGYKVFYAVDATGGTSERGEVAAMRAMDAAGATPTSVRSFAMRLIRDFESGPGRQILAAFQQQH